MVLHTFLFFPMLCMSIIWWYFAMLLFPMLTTFKVFWIDIPLFMGNRLIPINLQFTLDLFPLDFYWLFPTFTYLWIPIFKGKSKVAYLQWCVVHIKAKLASWKQTLLFMIDRIELVKSVIITYWFIISTYILCCVLFLRI